MKNEKLKTGRLSINGNNKEYSKDIMERLSRLIYGRRDGIRSLYCPKREVGKSVSINADFDLLAGTVKSVKE